MTISPIKMTNISNGKNTLNTQYQHDQNVDESFESVHRHNALVYILTIYPNSDVDDGIEHFYIDNSVLIWSKN